MMCGAWFLSGAARITTRTKNQHGQTHAVLHTLACVLAFRQHISFGQALSRSVAYATA